jgi:hypothetical protein
MPLIILLTQTISSYFFFILNDILGLFIFNMHINTKKNSLFNDMCVVYRLPLDFILFVVYYSMNYGQYRRNAVCV